MNIFRRKYFIYPEVQKPLLWQVFIGLTVISVLQLAGLYLAMHWMAQQVQADITLVVDQRVLGPWKFFLMAAIVVPMIVNLLIGLGLVLLTSNKFAGPLFRLEREIDRYLAQETASIQVQFRTNDYLHSLAKKINLISQKDKSIN